MDKVFYSLGASNHYGERQTENFYATDPIAIDCLLKKEPDLFKGKTILEPCAGTCALSDRITELTGEKIDCYDLVKRKDNVIQADYFTTDFSNKYDVIITNPPYLRDTMKSTSGLSDLIVKALKEVKVGGTVCMFLKVLALESQVRYEKIYKNFPPTKIYVFADRVSCYKNDEDRTVQGAIAYCWCIWKNKKDNGTFDNNCQVDWIRYK